jgi:hypothetical protein
MGRRSFVRALPLAAAAAALPAPVVLAAPSSAVASSDPDAKLRALMTAWQAQYRASNSSGFQGKIADDIKFQRLLVIEAQVSEVRPATVQGFAIKLMVATHYGEFDLDGPMGEAFHREAETLCGFSPPWKA